MGKGSARRVEDISKVHEGYSRIFGESKLERRLREEREAAEQTAEEDDDLMCPECRSDLIVKCLASKEDSALMVSWHKYCHYCPECGYKSFPWETVD